MKKEIKKRLSKKCLCCGREVRVIVYSKSDYRGGHFFGKLPLTTKAEDKKSFEAGTHIEKIGDFEMNVLNIDPKPYAFVEYWECPKCYWGGRLKVNTCNRIVVK